MGPRYRNRFHAGKVLAQRLRDFAGSDGVVLALPRGGVPVAYEVARALGAPLDIFLVRKLGVPGHEELAMGAVAEGGVRLLNREVVEELGIPASAIEAVARDEGRELTRRADAYREHHPAVEVRGKIAILVDDGLATGSSMRAAVEALRKRQPARIVIAVPIAAPSTCAALADEVDEVICAATPEPFRAVGLWYEDFTQVSDDEVRELLARARGEAPGAPAGKARTSVQIPVGPGVTLEGELDLPPGARGVVLFAHGSGSGRHSPRNQAVAAELRRAGLATLLIDLLTPAEEESERWTRHLRFDIELLAARLVAASEWLAGQRGTSQLALGYFGASTGAAAALVAAAVLSDLVSAVVSRGGRPDLAGPALRRVAAPALLIVGGEDTEVIELNRRALAELRVEKRLVIIPGATHLFEEPGALEQVAALAGDWFAAHLGTRPDESPQPAP